MSDLLRRQITKRRADLGIPNGVPVLTWYEIRNQVLRQAITEIGALEAPPSLNRLDGRHEAVVVLEGLITKFSR